MIEFLLRIEDLCAEFPTAILIGAGILILIIGFFLVLHRYWLKLGYREIAIFSIIERFGMVHSGLRDFVVSISAEGVWFEQSLNLASHSR